MTQRSDEPPVRQRGADIGPTGKTVAANLKAVRERRGLDLRTLAERLKAAGRYIAPSALSKIENEARRVEVDELMALAAVLNVSPLAILLPNDKQPLPTGTPAGVIREEVLAWAHGETNLNPHARHQYWTGQAIKAKEELELLQPQLGSAHDGMRAFAVKEAAALEAKIEQAHDRMRELDEVIAEDGDGD